VHRQLVVLVERGEHRQRDQVPRAAVEAGPRPDAAPRHFGDEALEVGVDRRGGGLRARDVLVAEDLLPDGQAPLERVVRHVRVFP
jgi:hypothetical protein